jgi:5-formyltetrahydrofolate cyclo-ligase
VDRGGRRIGYGGGFYDRFLPGTPAARIVPVFRIQLVDEVLPSGPGDVGVDVIVTERETIRIDLNRRSTTW